MVTPEGVSSISKMHIKLCKARERDELKKRECFMSPFLCHVTDVSASSYFVRIELR